MALEDLLPLRPVWLQKLSKRRRKCNTKRGSSAWLVEVTLSSSQFYSWRSDLFSLKVMFPSPECNFLYHLMTELLEKFNRGLGPMTFSFPGNMGSELSLLLQAAAFLPSAWFRDSSFSLYFVLLLLLGWIWTLCFYSTISSLQNEKEVDCFLFILILHLGHTWQSSFYLGALKSIALIALVGTLYL
jgi:hypothetical protein